MPSEDEFEISAEPTSRKNTSRKPESAGSESISEYVDSEVSDEFAIEKGSDSYSDDDFVI